MIAAAEYRLMREVEDAHWWFDGMERITACLLDRAGLPERPSILDAGCGTGRNLGFLASRGSVTGVDYSPLALDCCRERGCGRLICASVNQLPLAAESFDLVTSFDVLTPDAVGDRAALAEFRRVLRPGGRVLVRVAAYDWLRGRHDRQWAIGRRYGRRDLCAKFAAAGFDVLHASYANFWLLPAVVIKRLLERENAESDLKLAAGQGLGPTLLRTLLSSEAALVANPGLPAGSSLFILARN
jgi:SAM-dependent methyltransferase